MKFAESQRTLRVWGTVYNPQSEVQFFIGKTIHQKGKSKSKIFEKYIVLFMEHATQYGLTLRTQKSELMNDFLTF